MKFTYILSALLFTFGSHASRINCREAAPGFVLKAVAFSESELRDLKLGTTNAQAPDRVIIKADVSYILKDTNYRPTKYKNSVRFQFDSTVDRDFSYKLIFPNGFSKQRAFPAVIINESNDGGSTYRLTCSNQ